MHVVGPGKQVIDRRRPRQQMFPGPEHAAAGTAAYLTRGLPPDSLFSDGWPQVAKGADAVLTAYQAVGLGWIVWVFRLKITGERVTAERHRAPAPVARFVRTGPAHAASGRGSGLDLDSAASLVPLASAIDARRACTKQTHTISKLVPPFIARRMFGAVNSLNQMSTAAQGLGCDDEEECELPLDDETDA
eukprot:scaffold2761_cov148-Isochrysis_galbana.AAC.5